MTIAEVGKKYDISADTLRYYERIGLIQVHRRESGIRNYSDTDCARIEFIKCMRNAGLSIEFLQEYMQLFEAGNTTIPERLNLLIRQREILAQKRKEMEETWNRLNQKIEQYDRVLAAEKKI